MATTQEQLGEILRMIGQLEANSEGLRRDVGDLKREASEVEARSSDSRERLYRRVEGLGTSMSKVESDAKLAVATSAQARDAIGHLTSELQHHSQKLDAHIKVVVPVLRRVRRLEWRLTLFLTGLSALGGLIWWGVSSNAAALWKALLQMLPKG